MSCWLDTSFTLSKCTVNVLVVFFCLFVCELLAGFKLHFVKVYSQCAIRLFLFVCLSFFVCLFVSCWLDSSFTLSKCRVNVLFVFICLFVCELLAGHKPHIVKVYSQCASRLLLFVCLWVVGWTQASLCQSVQLIVFFFWVVGWLFVWVIDRRQASLFQNVQSMC